MSIHCDFNQCIHNCGVGVCAIEPPTLILYTDGYNMLFTCAEMNLQEEQKQKERENP